MGTSLEIIVSSATAVKETEEDSDNTSASWSPRPDNYVVSYWEYELCLCVINRKANGKITN